MQSPLVSPTRSLGTRLVDDGALRAQVSAVYPLEDAARPSVAKSAEHIPGKVVLTPEGFGFSSPPHS